MAIKEGRVHHRYTYVITEANEMLYNPRAVETLRFAGLNEENLASQVIHASFLMFFEDHSRFDFEKLS